MPVRCSVKKCNGVAAFRRGNGNDGVRWCGECYIKLIEQEEKENVAGHKGI